MSRGWLVGGGALILGSVVGCGGNVEAPETASEAGTVTQSVAKANLPVQAEAFTVYGLSVTVGPTSDPTKPPSWGELCIESWDDCAVVRMLKDLSGEVVFWTPNLAFQNFGSAESMAKALLFNQGFVAAGRVVQAQETVPEIGPTSVELFIEGADPSSRVIVTGLGKNEWVIMGSSFPAFRSVLEAAEAVIATLPPPPLP